MQKLGVSKFQRQVVVACWSPARAASWAVPPRRSIYPPHKLLSCAVLPSFGSRYFSSFDLRAIDPRSSYTNA